MTSICCEPRNDIRIAELTNSLAKFFHPEGNGLGGQGRKEVAIQRTCLEAIKQPQFQKLNLDPEKKNRKNSLGSAGDDRVVVSHVVVSCNSPRLIGLFPLNRISGSRSITA